MRRVLVVLATVVVVAAVGYAAAPALGAQDGDREIAEAGVFQEGDFPVGWRATPHKRSKTDLNDCPALKKAVGSFSKNRSARESSDNFRRRDDRYESTVAVYRTEDVARRAYGAAASNDMRRCVTRLAKDAVEKSAEGYDVKVEAGTVTGAGSYGDESSDINVKFTLSRDDLSQDIFADYAFVRVGRALGVYFRASTSESSEFDTPTFDGLITAATERLTTATGGAT